MEDRIMKILTELTAIKSRTGTADENLARSKGIFLMDLSVENQAAPLFWADISMWWMSSITAMPESLLIT